MSFINEYFNQNIYYNRRNEDRDQVEQQQHATAIDQRPFAGSSSSSSLLLSSLDRSRLEFQKANHLTKSQSMPSQKNRLLWDSASGQWKLVSQQGIDFIDDKRAKKTFFAGQYSLLQSFSPMLMAGGLFTDTWTRGLANSQVILTLRQWIWNPLISLWRWFIFDFLLGFASIKWTILVFALWPLIAFFQTTAFIVSQTRGWFKALLKSDEQEANPTSSSSKRRPSSTTSKRGLKVRVKEWLSQRQNSNSLKGSGSSSKPATFSVMSQGSSSQSASSINTSISRSSDYSSVSSATSTASWYALRSPEAGFLSVQDFPFVSKYFEFLGYRCHYIDEQNVEMTVANEVILMIHGGLSWSFGQRKVIKDLRDKGYRVIALDLIGYGKSDKCTMDMEPLETMMLHQQTIIRFIQKIGASLGESKRETRLTLVCEDIMTYVALMVLSQPLPFKADRNRLVLVNPWKPALSPFEFYLHEWHSSKLILASLYYLWTRCLGLSFPLSRLLQLVGLERWDDPPFKLLNSYDAPLSASLNHAKALDLVWKTFIMQPLLLVPWNWVPAFAVPLLDWLVPSWIMYSSTREEFIRCRDLLMKDVPGSLSSILLLASRKEADSNPTLMHHFPELKSLLWSLLEYVLMTGYWLLTGLFSLFLDLGEDGGSSSSSQGGRKRRTIIRMDVVDGCRWLPMEEQPDLVSNRIHDFIADKFT